MLIDWFTVVAQIVNFVVLVALLKHFLWARVIQAIDQRERHIAARVNEAEEKNKQAAVVEEQARADIAALGAKGEAIVHQARQEAADQRNQMIQRARAEVRGLEARWHEDLEREQTAFLEELKRRAASEMLNVIRRALGDLTGASVQECATQTFVQKLGKLDPSLLRDLIGKELTVVSAAEVPETARREIQAALEAQLGSPVPLRFQRSAALPWGLELRGNGRRIGWTPDSYVESLEENLKTALEHRHDLVTR